MARIYHIEGIGAVIFERSSRARRLIISVKPFRGVRVAIPHGATMDMALDFVKSRASWILKHLHRMRDIECTAPTEKAAPVDTVAARRILAPRLDALASRHGFTFGRLTIRNQKTRWGSCSSTNNISLNARLIKLPDELRDYVILHELVHTRIKNHGPSFWEMLDRLIGDSRDFRRRMRKIPIASV